MSHPLRQKSKRRNWLNIAFADLLVASRAAAVRFRLFSCEAEGWRGLSRCPASGMQFQWNSRRPRGQLAGDNPKKRKRLGSSRSWYGFRNGQGMKEGERGLSVTKPIGTVKNEHTRRGKSQGPLVTGYRLQRNRFHAHDAACNKCSKRIGVGEGQNKGARGKKRENSREKLAKRTFDALCSVLVCSKFDDFPVDFSNRESRKRANTENIFY